MIILREFHFALQRLGVSVKRKNRYREKAYTFAGAKVQLFRDIRKKNIRV
jgi:hypothetical protein